MKLHRYFLLFSIGLLFAFSASSQDLLPHKATYKYVKGFFHVSPGVYSPYVFFEDRLQLDSQKLDTAYYSVKRRMIRSHDVYEYHDSTDYQLIIYDSAIYFTGDLMIRTDSIKTLNHSLIFDYKLKTGDSLILTLYSEFNDGHRVRKILKNDTTGAKVYGFYYISPFDSRFGFRKTGLLPYDIIPGGSFIELLSVCTDSLLFYNKNELSEYIDDINFCDSLVLLILLLPFIKRA